MKVEDLAKWEMENGKIPEGALVVMKTGWGERFASSTKENLGGDYLNKDSEGNMHFPGFSVEAARWLVAERNFVGIGIDTPSLDYGLTSIFPVHVIILGADKYQIENMKLDEVPAG
jgi:kynurenine formamidase